MQFNPGAERTVLKVKLDRNLAGTASVDAMNEFIGVFRVPVAGMAVAVLEANPRNCV